VSPPFAELEQDFLRITAETVFCTATTVDAAGRPRNRILHPIFVVRDGRPLASWVDEDAEKEQVWDLFLSTPEPLGWGSEGNGGIRAEPMAKPDLHASAARALAGPGDARRGVPARGPARQGVAQRTRMRDQGRRQQRAVRGVGDESGERAAMTEHAVVIAGGGPTGLMLAGELALARVDVAIVERRASQELAGTRAGGLHSRTIEVFDQRGIADRFVSEGQVAQVHGFGRSRLDISDFPSRHPYSLGLWQNHIERIMAGWVDELEVPINRGREVSGFAQDETGVDVELSNGETLRAEYLVGCDGGRSVVRKAAGIDFPGWDATTSSLIAEVEMSEAPELGIRHDERGTHALGKRDYEIVDGEVVFKEGGPVGVMVTEETVGTTEPTLRDLREALIDVYGTDYGLRKAAFISRFTDATRQAASYREGRVFLAGDAAHVHYPVGGQGLNTGVQDAVNLGWKLAQVVDWTSPEGLLDTYHAERHPVAARILQSTMAQTALTRPGDDRLDALRDTVAELLSLDEARKHVAGTLSGLDIHYDLGEGHPLLGRRMPDLDLVTADGPLRVFTLLHDARPVLLNFAERGGLDITPWADRVRLVDAEYAGSWELPVLGAVTAPAAVLIRPDGHVAWVGDGTEVGLPEALTAWFGAPKAPVAAESSGMTAPVGRER
jgi:2-polyprenyl-6-methoxyphenol hydroxylase-like FAD-dependent oxidoreductase